MQRIGIPLKLARNVVSYSRCGISTIDNADKPKSIVFDSAGGKKDTATTHEEKKRIDDRTEKQHQRNKEPTSTEPAAKEEHQPKKRERGSTQGGKVDKPPTQTQDKGRYVERPQDFWLTGRKVMARIK